MANENDAEPLAVPTFLKQWREFRDLTQEQLAEKIGQTGSSISQLERGKQGFGDKTLADLAAALECSPVDILAFDPKQPNSFWPLFHAAERLKGPMRQQLYNVLAAFMGREAI